MKAIMAITKRLLASNIISYIITGAVVLLATSSGNTVLSNGNYTWLLSLMTPFFFVFYDFKRLIYLGASKRDYFVSVLISYGILAIAISLLNTLIKLLIDPIYQAEIVYNLMDICRWTENGIFIAFIQQAFFLLLIMVFLHVLLSMQEHWYGWLSDVLIITIISIFTPITPLRAILASFFSLIMINNNALLHILSCALLTAALSLIGITVLKRKAF